MKSDLANAITQVLTGWKIPGELINFELNKESVGQ